MIYKKYFLILSFFMVLNLSITSSNPSKPNSSQANNLLTAVTHQFFIAYLSNKIDIENKPISDIPTILELLSTDKYYKQFLSHLHTLTFRGTTYQKCFLRGSSDNKVPLTIRWIGKEFSRRRNRDQ